MKWIVFSYSDDTFSNFTNCLKLWGTKADKGFFYVSIKFSIIKNCEGHKAQKVVNFAFWHFEWS